MDRLSEPSKTRVLALAGTEIVTYLLIVAAVLLGGRSQVFLPGGPWDRMEWSLLVAAACVAGLPATIALRSRDMRYLRLPLLLFSILAVIHVLQLIPLPSGLPGLLAPGRPGLERELGTQAITGTSWQPASVDPGATLDSLLLLLAYAAAFVIGWSVFGRKAPFVRLAVVLTILGIAASGSGLPALLLGPDSVPMRLTGSYLNANRFCDLLCLCLGAGVAGVLLLSGSWVKELPGSWCRRAAGWRGARWALVAGVGMVQLAILATLSRLGIASMALAWLAAVYLMRREPGRREVWAVLGIAGAITAINAWLLFEPALARYSLLFEPGGLAGGRPLCWWHSLGLWLDFPLMGSGSGTYRNAFPPYQPPGMWGSHRYPHSELVGVLCSMGLMGLATTIAAATLLARRLGLALRSGLHGRMRAAPGLFLGLGAVALHSLGDFGLRVPATAFLFLLLAGSAWRMLAREESAATTPGPAERYGVPALLATAFAAAACFALQSARSGALLKTPPPEMTVFLNEGSLIGGELARASAADRLWPGQPDTVYRLARAQVMAADRERSAPSARKLLQTARQRLHEVIRRRPVSPSALWLLSRVQRSLGADDEADRALTAASRAAPAYEEVQLGAGQVLATRSLTERTAGRADRSRELWTEAMECLRRAAMSDRGSARPAIEVAMAAGADIEALERVAGGGGISGRLELATALIEADGMDRALLVLGRLRTSGGLTDAQSEKRDFLTGRASLAAGDIAGAREAFTSQAMRVPGSRLGRTLSHQQGEFARRGKLAEALDYMMELETELGESADLLAAIGDVARSLRDADLALTYYERALKLDPAHAAARHAATLLIRRGEAETAAMILRGAVARDPHNSAMRLAYAKALIATGQRRQALYELKLLRGTTASAEAERLIKEYIRGK